MLAKAKEAASQSKVAAQASHGIMLDGGCGPPPFTTKKVWVSKSKSKPCVIPSRSSLHIKNISSK